MGENWKKCHGKGGAFTQIGGGGGEGVTEKGVGWSHIRARWEQQLGINQFQITTGGSAREFHSHLRVSRGPFLLPFRTGRVADCWIKLLLLFLWQRHI